MSKIFQTASVAATVGAIMVGGSYYLEHELGLEPCTLCYFQRYLAILVTAILTILLLFRPFGFMRRIFGLLAFAPSAAGTYVSFHHIQLQNLPKDQLPAACAPNLHYLIQNFPIKKVVEILTQQTGDCAKMDWSALGLTLPQWSMIGFSFLCFSTLVLIFAKR